MLLGDLHRDYKNKLGVFYNPFKLIDIQSKYAHAGSTDISGFGLMGHLISLAMAEKVSIEINHRSISVVLNEKKIPLEGVCSIKQNSRDFEGYVKWHSSEVDTQKKMILFNGETNGPILSIVKNDEVKLYLEELRAVGLSEAGIIGSIIIKKKLTN